MLVATLQMERTHPHECTSVQIDKIGAQAEDDDFRGNKWTQFPFRDCLSQHRGRGQPSGHVVFPMNVLAARIFPPIQWSHAPFQPGPHS